MEIKTNAYGSIWGENRRLLGEALRAGRKRADLTQEEVTQRLGVERSIIAQIEIGKHRRPRPDELVRLAQWYGMDLAQLLQACEAPDDAQVFLVVTESEHRIEQRLLKQKPPLDDTKVFLAVTETEHAVLQRLLSQEPEPSLLRALEALGISETICERLAATLLARLIRQEGECGGGDQLLQRPGAGRVDGI